MVQPSGALSAKITPPTQCENTAHSPPSNMARSLPSLIAANLRLKKPRTLASLSPWARKYLRSAIPGLFGLCLLWLFLVGLEARVMRCPFGLEGDPLRSTRDCREGFRVIEGAGEDGV